jgi:hypothetical protein
MKLSTVIMRVVLCRWNGGHRQDHDVGVAVPAGRHPVLLRFDIVGCARCEQLCSR